MRNFSREECFCPRCKASLNRQKGFMPDVRAWHCLACGQLLFRQGIYAGEVFPNVMWFCDRCGVLLNEQRGFSDLRRAWRCRDCGCRNAINRKAILKLKAGSQQRWKTAPDGHVLRREKRKAIAEELCAEDVDDGIHFRENDVVRLRTDYAGIPAGTTGTVVSRNDSVMLDVEFVNDQLETIDIVLVPGSCLGLVQAYHQNTIREIEKRKK